MDKLERLKFNIKEAETPYFTNEQLLTYLDICGGDVNEASYMCLIVKAETTGLNVSGLTTKDSSSYFKMLASQFVSRNSGVLS